MRNTHNEIAAAAAAATEKRIEKKVIGKRK